MIIIWWTCEAFVGNMKIHICNINKNQQIYLGILGDKKRGLRRHSRSNFSPLPAEGARHSGHWITNIEKMQLKKDYHSLGLVIFQYISFLPHSPKVQLN